MITINSIKSLYDDKLTTKIKEIIVEKNHMDNMKYKVNLTVSIDGLMSDDSSIILSFREFEVELKFNENTGRNYLNIVWDDRSCGDLFVNLDGFDIDHSVYNRVTFYTPRDGRPWTNCTQWIRDKYQLEMAIADYLYCFTDQVKIHNSIINKIKEHN